MRRKGDEHDGFMDQAAFQKLEATDPNLWDPRQNSGLDSEGWVMGFDLAPHPYTVEITTLEVHTSS